MTRALVTLEARALLMGLLAPAKASPERLEDVVAEWGRYFHRMNLMLPDEQTQEVEGIMRVRVQAGSISVLAPRI